MNAPVRFDNSYTRLPGHFFARGDAQTVPAPLLVKLNLGLAEELGLDARWLSSADGVAMLAGNRFPEGADPVALAYAGHQFGQFVPSLGDGRALLVGEILDRGGRRRDIQLKGSGPTRFSRRGDGRAALGPVLREYIVSEAMQAMGVPTTRALAVVTTGEPVYRETQLPGAVLTRVAASHIRVGTFQYFAARQDDEALKALADHVIARHYSELQTHAEPYTALLDAVIGRQAALVARWLCLGFIHGVMNTDNTSISGETIDYGPCAFMDAYDPATVYSSIDSQGRYAYANQPRIAQWNLARLAEAMLPLLDADRDRAVEKAQALIETFRPRFDRAYLTGLRTKIGLETAEDEDAVLVQDLLDRMQAGHADFTLTFRALIDATDGNNETARVLFGEPERFDEWAVRWRERLARDPGEGVARMERVNPLYIPRNHHVEAVIRAAVDRGDFEPFETLARVLSNPFAEQPGRETYTLPPKPGEEVLQTFCGT